MLNLYIKIKNLGWRSPHIGFVYKSKQGRQLRSSGEGNEKSHNWIFEQYDRCYHTEGKKKNGKNKVSS